MTGFKGDLVWLIGASTGIGHALAIELAERGAILAVSARSLDKLGDLILKIGQGHTFHALDVTDAASVSKAFSELPRLPDRIIYLAGQYDPMSFEHMDMTQVQNIIATNLTGAITMISQVIMPLVQRGYGQIAITASVAGYRGLPHAQPYGATKAALINLTESLALDVRGKGIDVKLICPGFVRTRLTDKNAFKMPMMIEPEAAAIAIADGLSKQAFEIHFPKRFTLLMKLINMLPHPLYMKIAPK